MKPRIIIIGGGFGGLNVARGLKDVDVSMFLVGFRNKIFVVLAWLWSFLTNERAGRIITGDPAGHLKQVLGARAVFG